MRIVSLLPSTTEILFALGGGDDVVGVTFECDFPAAARDRRVVSTTELRQGLTPAEIDAEVRRRLAAGEDLYRLDRGALAELVPDLVVTQDLCAVCAIDVTTVDAAMEHLGCDGVVLTIDPSTLDEVVASILTIGSSVGRAVAAAALVKQLRIRLAAVRAAVTGRSQPRVAVIEWPDPPFSAGHWVPDMVTAAGGRCVLGKAGQRSMQIGWDAVAAAQPDTIVIAPCGFGLPDATRLAADLLERRALPTGCQVWAVDADAAFVRPGPRLVDGIEALGAILHPEALPARPDLATYIGAVPSIGASST